MKTWVAIVSLYVSYIVYNKCGYRMYGCIEIIKRRRHAFWGAVDIRLGYNGDISKI